jgi:hypothetical protein
LAEDTIKKSNGDFVCFQKEKAKPKAPPIFSVILISLVPEFALDNIIFVDGDAVIIGITDFPVNDIFEGLTMFINDMWGTKFDE